MKKPELASIDAFAEYLIDDDRETFTAEELSALCTTVRASTGPAILALRAYGLVLQPRPHERRIRGLNSNPHDRWSGPGSSPTHGGSGVDPGGGLRWGKGR